MRIRDAPESMPIVTRHEPDASPSELMPKRVRKPTQKAAKKPPCAPGYFWRRHGAGWDLRRDVYVTSHDGVRMRKQPYIAHMGREEFASLKRSHKGKSLERAIEDWIKSHGG